MTARTMLHAAFNSAAASTAIALPSFEELGEALDQASDGLQEVQDQVDGTEEQVADLQDELGSATALQQAVESLAGSTSPAAHRAVGIMLDHHLQRFNITLPSMENDAAPEEKTEAKAEANDGLIKRIIAAIKAALTKVAEYFKQLWQRLTGSKEKVDAAAKKIEEVLHNTDVGTDGVLIKLHPTVHSVWVTNGQFREPGLNRKIQGEELVEAVIKAIPACIEEAARAEGSIADPLTRHVLPLLKGAVAHAPLVDGWHVFKDFGPKPTAADVRFTFDEAAWNVIGDSSESIIKALDSVKFTIGTQEAFDSESTEVRLSKSQMLAVAKEFPPSCHNLEEAAKNIAHDLESGIRAADQLEAKLIAMSSDGTDNPHYEKHVRGIMALTGVMRRAGTVASQHCTMTTQQMMSVMRAVLNALHEKNNASAPAAAAPAA